MADKKFTWIKLKNDFFSSKRVKKLRKIAGGDTYTIIYQKLLLLTINSEGLIQFEGVYDNIAEELALEIDEEVENVQVTLNYLKSVGLLESNENNDLQFLTDGTWDVGTETSAAARMRNLRQRKKENLPCKNDEERNDVTQALRPCYECYALEKEREKEKEKELNTLAQSDSAPSPNCQGIFSLPLKNGTDYLLTQEDIDFYQKPYPNVNIEIQLERMKAWLESNPNSRKTKSGIRRFINSWLSRQQKEHEEKGAHRISVARDYQDVTPVYDDSNNPPVNAVDIEELKKFFEEGV